MKRKDFSAPKHTFRPRPLTGVALEAAKKAKIANQPQQPNRDIFSRGRYSA